MSGSPSAELVDLSASLPAAQTRRLPARNTPHGRTDGLGRPAARADVLPYRTADGFGDPESASRGADLT